MVSKSKSIPLDSGNMELSEPFIGIYKEYTCVLKLNLHNFIDGYDYHDFPGTEELYLDEKGLIEIKEAIELRLKQIQEMRNKCKP